MTPIDLTVEEASAHRALRRAHAAQFTAGDVVFDEEQPHVLGVVTETRALGMTISWKDGSRSGGGGQTLSIRHREPRVTVVVTQGMRSNRWWNRAQAVTAALRKLGVVTVEEEPG